MMNFFTFQFEILQILLITLLRQMNTNYNRESNEIMESSYEWSSTKTNVNDKNNIQFVMSLNWKICMLVIRRDKTQPTQHDFAHPFVMRYFKSVNACC